MVNKIDWSKAIFFFDVDDTLIDTASNSILASEAIFEGLCKIIEEKKAKEVQNLFNRIFQTLMISHTIKNKDDWKIIEGGKRYYDEFIEQIKFLQSPITKSFGGIKKWSREVFLKIALDESGVQLESKNITRLIDLYWQTLANTYVPIKGVLDLFEEISKHSRPVYLITSSDARLHQNDDGLFYYDPIQSEKFKIHRMELLKDKGIFFNAVSVGDPEDKPHRNFFEKALKKAKLDLDNEVNVKNIIIFGDSYAGDLQTPREQLGFGLVVLYRKNQPETIEEGDGYISTGNLSNITSYLK